MLETFDDADYNRAAGFLESMGLPVEMLAPPPIEVEWMIQKRRRQESTVWTSGPWTAEIDLASESKQLLARLHLAPDDVTMLDRVVIEPEDIPQGMTFESFEADMLTRFSAWIAKNGREALDDAILPLTLRRRHAQALLDATEDYMKQALADQDLDLAAAVMALKGTLLRALPL
mgnify:CR=1 FL=1